MKQHLASRIQSGDLAQDLSIIIRCTPQPWHASSTFVHGPSPTICNRRCWLIVQSTSEAFLAVVKAKPEQAWPFAYALMERFGSSAQMSSNALMRSAARQKEYFDDAVADESPKQTKGRLAKLAEESVGVDEARFLELVSTAKGNSGSGVTDDLKLQVKLGRRVDHL